MATIRETDLPGIGRKYQMDTRAGDKLVVVIHDDGRREIYHFDENDPDEPISQVTLEDEEARQIAGILGGMTYKPKALETIEVSLDELVIEWCRVEPHSHAANRTIEELQIRQKSGATILALVEKNRQTINPGPHDRLVPHMTLVVAGERKQIRQLKELLANG
ncbi:potassium transporter [Paenibacillus sp. J31TS4]|uniref:cation:proton antiporter regulatory subunit n=1 Tax=Paenibacillus sp. J31TS4 TaxID=2807195 RepID=UPI001B1635E8|nr:cation:proton antiporter regulatory subunit [Paenibacillus sp. J31TS4]GIP36910.1 potassium transporter [Paenibacillus sp. J31TS4]